VGNEILRRGKVELREKTAFFRAPKYFPDRKKIWNLRTGKKSIVLEVTNLSLERNFFFPSFKKWIRCFHDLLREK
jgi:hypothetical protein